MYTKDGDDMKKSIIFLINGLGIEKAGSYSISIDEVMPNLARTKETSYFTTAVISSLEYKSAYQQFFLGNTYKKDVNYINENIINDEIINNETYKMFCKSVGRENSKLHVFLEPTNENIVDAINKLINTLSIEDNKQVFLHLILTQQSLNEYKSLITIINYIKYHINTHITVGFIIGREYLSNELTKQEEDFMKKMLFYCSCERWSETDKKLNLLKDDNIRPCVAPGFCATTSCSITNGDTILFFNSKRTNYDQYIDIIMKCAPEVYKTDKIDLNFYSLITLDTKYKIPSFAENIVYENSLNNLLKRAQKKALIFSEEKNISLVNFLANGLTYVNNPDIQFMKLDSNYLSDINNVQNIIDNSDYDLIIFDYHMDVSKTINDLKAQLTVIDKVLGNVCDTAVNKHSVFITSLYGLKKTLPVAQYNEEMVTLDFELQIPIFFFDYSYPRSKYTLFPGETNDILLSAVRCIWDTDEVDTLIREKGIVTNILGVLKKK